MALDARTRATAASAPTVSTALEPETRVFVRMYRALADEKDLKTAGETNKDYKGLLGDCFLIRIEKGDLKSHILIDCGMLMGSPDAVNRMKKIAGHIVDTCGGKLDLLVVTHEHWDHISGFSQAEDILLDDETLKIDNIWLAWTEDDSDPMTQELRARFDKSGTALAAIAERLDNDRTARFGINARQTALDGLQGFLGATEAGAKPGKGKLQGREIMAKLKRPGITAYRRPGEVLPTPGAVPLSTYVLGPPHDKKKLFKDLPSKGDAQETYLDTPSFDSLMLRFAQGQDPDPDIDPPFARSYSRIDIDSLSSPLANGAAPEGDAREWLRARYYGLPNATSETVGAITRRRIDGDWLAAAGQMALKLDSDTNNTSLVLAFELPDADRSILLFAADAQVGNWESWHDQTYDAPDGTKQSATDLLARVRFYKVGHHGSHNATLEKKGLELMARNDLVAAIPTDEELGKAQGSSGWMMPNPRVNAALMARTKGRILRNDRTYLTASGEPINRPDLNIIERGFFEPLNEEPMFLEYQVLGSPTKRAFA